MDRKKILVVDDDAIITSGLSRKLKDGGYNVLIAVDGSEAVSTVRKEQPDLVILDITFPPDVAHGGGVAWDGFLIIQWLRRLEEGKDVPIIVITGAESQKFKDRSLAAGAAAFFHKPIDNDELLATVRKTLEAKPS
jgi:CheY-like chemotaxis protein